MLKPALEAGEALDATVVNMRFVKPLDVELVKRIAESHHLIVTVEEHQIMGGAGSAVAEVLAFSNKKLLLLGLPDRFIDHGDPGKLACVRRLRRRWNPRFDRKGNARLN